MQQLNIHFHKTYGIPAILIVSFGIRLQHAGSDYTVYANNGYTPQEHEHPVLRSVMELLFSDTSGVPRVKVEPFSLEIRYVDAVSPDDIEELVCAGVWNAGYEWVKQKSEQEVIDQVRDHVRDMVNRRWFTRADRQHVNEIAKLLRVNVPDVKQLQ